MCIVLSTLSFSKAQDTIFWRTNISGSYVVSQDIPGFERFEGMQDCCNGYDQSVGSGTIIALETGLRYWVLDLNLSVGYGRLDNFFYGEDTEPVLNNQREEVSGVFSHNLDTERMFLMPSLSLGINPIFDLRLYGGIGKILHQTTQYDYIEKLEEPKTGVFAEEDKRSRNPQNGEIINIADPFFYYGGISYNLPMSREWGLFLTPFGEYGKTSESLLTDNQWDHDFYKVGIGVTFEHGIELGSDDYILTSDTVLIIDTIIYQSIKVHQDNHDLVKKGLYQEKIHTDTIKKSNREYSVITTVTRQRTDTLYKSKTINLELNTKPRSLTIPVEIYTEAIPVLPYFFFEKGNTQLSTVQINSVNWQEDINNQKSRQMYLYQNLLTLLSNRINNSNGGIVVTGYIDPSTEDDCSLGRMRAEKIKSLLVERGAQPDKIIIRNATTANCAPEDMTKTQSQAAYTENRRVEIRSDDLSLFESFVISSQPHITDFEQKQINLEYKLTDEGNNKIISELEENDIVRASAFGIIEGKKFQSIPKDIKSPYGLWELNTRDNENNQITFDWPGQSAGMRLGVEEIILGIEMETISGQMLNESYNIPIVYDTSAISKSRLSIVLFPVGKSSLTKLARQELTNFATRLEPGTELNITGYADNIGDIDENANLAIQRAESVINYISSIRPDINIKLNKTEGRPIGIYSYNSPQERVFSRTVQIEANIKLTK